MENIFNKIDDISALKEIPSIKIWDKKILTDNKPFFTIAIPTYNRPSTLIEAIDSALKQHDIEDYNIIVCDNNPERDDETEKIMQRYINEPKITYYKHSINIGMAGNINKCALLSEADRFILLHDDDILSPYALSTFKKILLHVNNNWGIIKPNLQKFSVKSELKFIVPQKIILNKKCAFHYYGGDCTGAPTSILFNKRKFIQTGGAHQVYFPSLDYVLSFQMSKCSEVYTVENELGGYRVGVNESLSKSTMDKYFEMKFTINKMIFEKTKLPTFMTKSILTQRYYDDLEWVKTFYNMPDYNFENLYCKLYNYNSLWMKFFRIIYYKLGCKLIEKILRTQFNI